ncbi:MAG: hypothetical protein FWG63_01890 [Defluviitaleaceae bacterium]|nr:hypothetical protein [Defluviitaleaceae bacterium]
MYETIPNYDSWKMTDEREFLTIPTSITCEICGENVDEKDTYYSDANMDLCEPCIDNITVSEVLKMLNFRTHVAERSY